MKLFSNDKFKSILALIVVIGYFAMQFLVVINPGMQDDVVSARVQDVAIAVVVYYFYRKKDE